MNPSTTTRLCPYCDTTVYLDNECYPFCCLMHMLQYHGDRAIKLEGEEQERKQQPVID